MNSTDLAARRITFSAQITPTPISGAYRVGLFITAIAMLLLPLIYLALIAATGAGIWWHLNENSWLLERSSQWRTLAYITPAVAGGVLMFFMVKPILARAGARQETLAIQRETQPLLFALIDDICRQVGAPAPRRVDVNCAVNASAGFMRSPFNPLHDDLVLTIGLPLVTGLSARQLAGVLAHEFGHFAQGGGMRLTGIVRGVNGWFNRVVYERDAWDEKLERWSKNLNWQASIVLGIARGAVWLSRRVLWGLMYVGHAISCFMLRQMEYDADSYEVKLAGTNAFVTTVTRLRELGAATHFVYADMREGFQGGTLPADVSAFVAERCRNLPADVLEKLRATPEGKTGRFDTHPSDADRVRAAEAADAPGVIVNADVPAVELFSDFNALSEAATRHHFEHDFGLNLGELTLVDTDVAMHSSRAREQNFSAIDRLFGKCFSIYRPLQVPLCEMASLGDEELLAQFVQARSAMTAADSTLSDAYVEFHTLESKRQNAYAAQELLLAGFPAVGAQDFDLPAGTMAAATQAEERALEQQRGIGLRLDEFEGAASRLLGSAAVLLVRRSTQEGPQGEVGVLTDAAKALGEAIPEVRELDRLVFARATLQYNSGEAEQAEQIGARLGFLDGAITNRIGKIQRLLAGVQCPPAFSATAMTLDVRCGLPSNGSAARPDEVSDRLYKLYVEILGRLAALALEAEAQILVETA